MAYNFMEMSHYTNTQFVAVMGPLDISALGSYFQKLFPILLLPFLLMTLFDVYSRILNCLKIKRFQFTEDFNHSLIEDGKEIVLEERGRLERGIDHSDEKADTEREAAASARYSVNSRGVQFNREQYAAPSHPDDDLDSVEVPVTQKLKDGFSRFFGKKTTASSETSLRDSGGGSGSSRNNSDSGGVTESRYEAWKRSRKQKESSSSGNLTFDTKSTSDDLWSDFDKNP